MERKEIKDKELAFLLEEARQHPELFLSQTHVDDAKFLEKIGITLPKNIQENLFSGYLKLWPQDFIVEEVLKDNSIQTVNISPLLKDKQAGPGETLHATLVKCNLSTIEAIEEIALSLKTDKKNIQYAGIKDKDAITSQLISLRQANIEDIKKLSSPYFFLKDAYYQKGVMQVGGLEGNAFTILVRTDNSFDKEKFLKNVELVKQEGFFNFFYSQRFSNPRFINWFWGLLIMKGEYQNAVFSLLCSPGHREIPYFKNLRKEIEQAFGDWKEVLNILERLPLSFQNEIKLVRHLKDNGDDFMGALNQIPEQVQLWLYAYGSLLFNKKISQLMSENKSVPEKLPLILSDDKQDWMLYEEFLKKDGITQIPFEDLKPFKFIQFKKRTINTKEKVKIQKVAVVKEGVVLHFTLPKGCYATTFLSHLFQLSSGLPPSTILTNLVDTKAILEEASMQEVLERFKDVIISKSQNELSQLE